LEDAVRYFETATALAETGFTAPAMLVSCYSALGDAENARRAAQTALARIEPVVAQDRSNGHAMAYGAQALAVLGEAERAKEWMARALLINPENQLMRYNFACGLIAILHDADAALDMLGPVLAQDPGNNVRHAKIDPDLDALRDDPRFQAMLAAAEARLASGKDAPT
jgi:adenylate cyclase